MHFVYENCGFVAWNSAEIEFISIHLSKFLIVFIYFSIINAYSPVSNNPKYRNFQYCLYFLRISTNQVTRFSNL